VTVRFRLSSLNKFEWVHRSGPARFLLAVEFFELVEQFVDTKLSFSHEFVKY